MLLPILGFQLYFWAIRDQS